MVAGQGSSSNAGVTVALPVYNEERILVANTRRLMAHLDMLGVPYQILIGSNGSTDATAGLAETLHRADSRIDWFHLPERGVGLAFREFVRRARHPFLISLDMDLSADLVFVNHAVALSATHDIVVGSKKLGPQRRSMVRKAGSDLFLWCARGLVGLPYDDYSIGAKAYRLEFLRSVNEPIDPGSSYVLDLCFAAHLAGRPMTTVPVACEDRRASKFNLAHEAVYKFRRLFGLWGRTLVGRFPARARAGTAASVAMMVEKSR